MSKTVGNIKNVVVDKEKLLSIIKDNKQKHDAILEVAISGYWQVCKEKIEEKQQQFSKYLADLSTDFDTETDKILNKISLKENVSQYRWIPLQATMDYTLDLKYPEDHSEEYSRAIRSIELNVYDKIALTEQEFNQYVLNDWSWKNSFISSSDNYISKFSGRMPITTGYFNSICISGAKFF